MAKSKYQNYETEIINRSQIKNAPYNPRIMDKEAKKRLKEGIKKHGLVSALTWNKRTGNLVGGHQRLEQLDVLETKKDYDLSVCVIDVDEKEEAVLNVQLNNQSMQGDWDFDKLANMADDFNLDLSADLGFTDLDIELMFDGDDRFSQLMNTDESERTKGKLNEIKEERNRTDDKMAKKGEVEWYAVVVFQNEEDRNSFMNEISVPVYERYITADQVRRIATQT